MTGLTFADSSTANASLYVPPSTPIDLPDEAVQAQLAQGSYGGVGSVVAVTTGGLTINLLFDAAAMAAPAAFRAGIQQAAAILSSAISDHITINLKIDYSGTGGGAAAGPDNGQWESYSWVKSNLVNGATPGDPTFNALPSGSTIQGQSSVAVWNAQLKLWGIIGANDTTTDDGAATFATDIDPSLLVGVALHELTHAMGRVPYGSQPDIFDFYRFSSVGNRLFTGGATASPAYFSLDGGYTKLADYGQTSDASDLLNSGVQGTNDPFNEFYTGSTQQTLTAVDLKQLDALGFHLAGWQGTVIQTDGNTSLTLAGNNYYLNGAGGGTGPTLKFGGASVSVGEFGSIAPIGAIQTGSGYEIAWQIPGTNQLTFWTTDSNGNYTSNISGLVSGNSFTSESLEATFGQDFNHDGSIGVTASLVQTSGSTSLLHIADTFYMYVNGSGPQLKYGGTGVVDGEFGSITPIAAIQTASGYEVAWKIPGTNQFTFWATDANGNYTSNLSGLVAGTSFLVESMEAMSGRDFNGDGTIGVTASLVQTDGSTSLLHIADTYYMYVNGTGPQLKWGGAGVTDGEFGSITPIAAIQTSGGYDVAWKIPGTSQFTFWATDANGNYTSNLSGLVTGTSSTVESFEQTFHQDLNGDGIIGVPSTVSVATASATAATSTANTFDGQTLALATPATFTGHIVGFGSGGTAAQLDLSGMQFAKLQTSYNGISGTLSVSDGSTIALVQFTGSYTQNSFHFVDDGHGGTVISSTATATTPSPSSASAAAFGGPHDTFVFAQNFGQVSIADFTPTTDSIAFSKSVFASQDALVAAIQDDAHGNAVITDAAHDTITLQHVTTAQLLAHLTDFHIV
ncbi:NF038122 family metalloprotease [Bradyrhizobium sp. SZCCHNR1070]|uniref:NF038122 family metalloprotease n=1 Tax=Bradyrhizobium sp. SZCCHNR1070 TaxID=3057361 RepID=UPI002915C490|nr:NF038122 family metalloprotease [Bradyrhizobium sp. SZCCHNR1070]